MSGDPREPRKLWELTVTTLLDADTASDAMDEAARQMGDLPFKEMRARLVHVHDVVDGTFFGSCAACHQEVRRIAEIAADRRNR